MIFHSYHSGIWVSKENQEKKHLSKNIPNIRRKKPEKNTVFFPKNSGDNLELRGRSIHPHGPWFGHASGTFPEELSLLRSVAHV